MLQSTLLCSVKSSIFALQSPGWNGGEDGIWITQKKILYTVRKSFREFQKSVYIDLLSNGIFVRGGFTTFKFCQLSEYVHF